MKPIRFLGDSLKRLREFPEDARQEVGYQLDKVLRGNRPDEAEAFDRQRRRRDQGAG